MDSNRLDLSKKIRMPKPIKKPEPLDRNFLYVQTEDQETQRLEAVPVKFYKDYLEDYFFDRLLSKKETLLMKYNATSYEQIKRWKELVRLHLNRLDKTASGRSYESY